MKYLLAVFALSLAWPARPAVAQTPHSCTGTGGGGAPHLSNRVSLAYAMSWDSGGLRLNAAMLLRGQPGWDHGSAARASLPDSMPMLPGDHQPELNGGMADTVSALYDRAKDLAWIGGRRIPMHGANVVLVDRADGVGGPPVVTKLIHIDPHLAQVPSPCKPHVTHEDYMAYMTAIRKAVLASEEVQNFIRETAETNRQE
jgi:hypothetical protein